MIRRLHAKLRGRSRRELTTRARQYVTARLESRGVIADARVPGDDSMRRRIAAGGRVPTHVLRDTETLTRYLAYERAEPAVVPGFGHFDETAATILGRWPKIATSIVTAADRIVDGEFDLLGFRGLRFGQPVDWHLDPISATRAPMVPWYQIRYLDPGVVGDHKIVWELNRHQHFVTLGQAYQLTGDERYVRCYAERVAHWMKTNPPNYGVNWASSLEIGFRAIAWLWAQSLFRGASCLAPSLTWKTAKYLMLHGRHIERHLSTYFSPNTHLTGEALALMYLGAALPELPRAPRWLRLGWDILTAEIQRQTHADGVHVEHSAYYHRYATEIYLHGLLIACGANLRIDPTFEPMLVRMLDHLRDLTRPDGTTGFIGDDDGGRLLPLEPRAGNDFRATLAIGAAVVRHPGNEWLSESTRTASSEPVWLMGPSFANRAAGVETASLPYGSRGYEAGGFFVLRDGWSSSSNHAVISCSRATCGHAHDDALSLEITALGRPMLVDPGSFTYTASASERDAFRSGGAHNSVLVDGESGAVPGGPFGWRQPPSATARRWSVTGSYADLFSGTRFIGSANARQIEHRRTVLFIRGQYWVVYDEVIGAGRHEIVAGYQGAIGTRLVRQEASRGVLASPDDAVELLLAACGDDVRVEYGTGSVSSAYGQREEAPRFRIIAQGSERIGVATCIVPTASRDYAIVAGNMGVDGCAVTITIPTGVRDLIVFASAAEVSADGLRTDARCAWLRRASDGEPRSLALFDGSFTEVDGAVVLRRDQKTDVDFARRNLQWEPMTSTSPLEIRSAHELCLVGG